MIINRANKCDGCGSTKGTISIMGKVRDTGTIFFPDGSMADGYLPLLDGVCEDSYMSITICLDCGKIQDLDLEQINDYVVQCTRR